MLFKCGNAIIETQQWNPSNRTKNLSARKALRKALFFHLFLDHTRERA